VVRWLLMSSLHTLIARVEYLGAKIHQEMGMGTDAEREQLANVLNELQYAWKSLSVVYNRERGQ
jgi:hypothetical protein